MGKKILVSVVSSWILSTMFGMSYLGFLQLNDLKIRNNMCVLFIIFHRRYVNAIEYHFQVNLCCL